jgi:hypothetical protein
MSAQHDHDVTALLIAWRGGDEAGLPIAAEHDWPRSRLRLQRRFLQELPL